MVAETKEMTPDAALNLLQAVKKMVVQHREMIEEIHALVVAAAELGFDTVDSKLLLDILQRRILLYQEIAKEI